MTIELWGALAFGVVVGWITYRTLRRTQTTGLSDLATVIGAVGGAAITVLFPQQSEAFGAYGIGLAIGFFGYFAAALVIASRNTGLSTVNEWLGAPETAALRREPPPPVPNAPQPPGGRGIPPMPGT